MKKTNNRLGNQAFDVDEESVNIKKQNQPNNRTKKRMDRALKTLDIEHLERLHNDAF